MKKILATVTISLLSFINTPLMARYDTVDTDPKYEGTGNRLFKDYINQTDLFYWDKDYKYSGINLIKRIDYLREYATNKYGEHGDMTTLVKLISALLNREHTSAPDLSAITDTTWAICHGVRSTYVGDMTGTEGRLDKDAKEFGAEHGINLQEKANFEDLEIFTIAMIASRLTEPNTESQFHPLDMRSRIVTVDTVNGKSADNEQIKQHRLIISVLSLLTKHLEITLEPTGALGGDEEGIAKLKLTKYTGRLPRRRIPFVEKGANSMLKEWRPNLQKLENKKLLKPWEEKRIDELKRAIEEYPKVVAELKKNNRVLTIEEIKQKYDKAVEKAVYATTHYSPYHKGVRYFGSDQVKPLEKILKNEKFRDFYVERYIWMMWLNEIKWLISRESPDNLIKEDQLKDEERQRKELANINSGQLVEANIEVGEKIKKEDVRFQFEEYGHGVQFLFNGGASVHRNAGLTAKKKGAIVTYHQLDPTRINVDGASNPAEIRKQMVKPNLRQSVLSLGKFEGDHKNYKSLPAYKEVRGVEKELKNPGLRIVSLGDPDKNGLFVLALPGSLKDKNGQLNQHPVFRMIVQPSGNNTIKDSFASTNPDKSRFIANSLFEYLQELGGKELSLDRKKTRDLGLTTLKSKNSEYTQVFSTAKKITMSRKEPYKNLPGLVKRFLTNQGQNVYEHKGTLYLKAYVRYEDYKKKQFPMIFTLDKSSLPVGEKTLDFIRKINNEYYLKGYFHLIGDFLVFVKIKATDKPEFVLMNHGTYFENKETGEKGLGAENMETLNKLVKEIEHKEFGKKDLTDGKNGRRGKFDQLSKKIGNKLG